MNSSTRRTPTGHQNIFKLSRPDPVIFDFSSLSKTGLKITIPPYSGWIAQSHWHETILSCETLEPLEGSFMISDSFVTSRGSGNVNGRGKGFVMPVLPLQIVKWQRDPRKTGLIGEAVVFGLNGSNQIFDFYRQVCSVNQDAELLLLRIQLRVMYHKHDPLVDEGRIPFTRPWRDLPGAQKPPLKWSQRELKSLVMISKLVQKWCYWTGTALLGMREWYEEYDTANS